MKFKPTEPSDEELVALHFRDAMNTPEEELPENEEPEEETEEVEANAAPVIPTPLAPAPAKRPRGRPPKGQTKYGPVGVGKLENFSDEWPIQAVEVWDRIVSEELPKRHLTPENTYCLVYRYGMGAFSKGFTAEEAKDQVFVARIEGPSIGGTPSQAPSEALQDYMEMVVHPQANGPARYELAFNVHRGGGTIKKGYMSMPHPTEIARRRAFAGEHAARQAMSGSIDPVMGPQPMPRTGYGQSPQYYHPQLQIQPQPYYAPPAQDSGEVAAMRRDLATVLGRFDEMNRRDAEARGAPVPAPIAPQVVPPPVESEEVRIARIVKSVLQETGVVAKPVGVGAPAAIAQTGPAGVVEQAKAGIGALREFMGMFKELDKFRKEVGIGGVEENTVVEIPSPTVEDPNSPAFGVRPIPFSNFQGKPVMWPKKEVDEEGNAVEESFLARLAKFGAANPDLSMAVLERASKVLSQGAFGQLLQAFTQQGGLPAQAAATMADRVAAGVAAPNGAAPPTGYPTP